MQTFSSRTELCYNALYDYIEFSVFCSNWENAMPFQPAPGMAEMSFIWTYQARVLQNRIYFFHSGGTYVENDLQSLAVIGDAWVQNNQKALISANLSYARTEVRGKATENDFLKTVITSAGAGTRVGVLVPLNVSFSIKLASIYTGRSARGRYFAFGMVDTDIQTVKDLATAAYRDGLVTALTALKNNTVAAGWAMCIASRWHNGVKRTEAIPFSVAVITYVNNDLDTQRKRIP